jgi:ATP adenylyltransferase
MDYVTGKRGDGCIFCEFPAKGPASFREDLVLVVQPHAFVCLNRYPFTTSHLLVVPRRHASDLDALEPAEYQATTELLRASAARLRAATNAQGLNIGMNLGVAAGAGIADHLHWHIVPRYGGDTNFMPVIADVRVMPEYLDDAWKRLYRAFADVEGERAPAPKDAP